MSLASKIQNLIDAGNETTGESSTDLTGVMQDLIDGYGGGVTKYTVTNNLATNLVTNNNATRVNENASYAATISSSHVDYQVNVITVTMGGTNITSTAVTGNEISIASVTGNIVITATALFYPSVDTNYNTLTVTSAGTGSLGVKLHAQPTQSQTVSLYSDTLTLSSNSLTFTTSNWDTYQSVTVTAPSVDTTTYAYINITNSDPMMTESTVMVTVKELEYEDLVDTTIPTTGRHILTASDFDETSDITVSGVTYIRLKNYIGAYTNIVVPSTIDGKQTWILNSTSTTSFAGNTTIEYVTFEDGVIYRTWNGSGCDATSLFNGCTSLIGVSNMNTNVTSMQRCFYGCTSFKFLDNLDELVNVTTLEYCFHQTSVDYIQDLSGLTEVTTCKDMLSDAPNLKKVFGAPVLSGTGINHTGIYSTCPSLTSATIPSGAGSLSYAFYNDTALRTVKIYEDGLTTSQIVSTTFSGCSNLTVYCNANTTTYASLSSVYASSSNVTIKTFDGASIPSIVVWGDSISSPNTSWIEWPARLQTKLGTSQYLIKNEALSGEWSTSTTARQGGYALTVGAFTIPANTTATEITITVNGNESFSDGGSDVAPNAGIFTAGASFNPCTISGVSGYISRSGSQYYFTRLEDGIAVSVASGSTITSNKDTYFNNSDNVMLYFLNGNAGWHGDGDVLLDMLQKSINHFVANGGTKYIVCGPSNSHYLESEPTRSEIFAFETAAATAFGNHWLNMREYQIQNGLTQNNLTASTLDTERMLQQLIPASIIGGGTPENIIMYDGVTVKHHHPNVYGANTIMLGFYEKGVSLGYWT